MLLTTATFIVLVSCWAQEGNLTGSELYQMAENLYNGTDGEFMDREKSFEYYKKSAEEGFRPALRKLVEILKDGTIVEKDTVAILYWTHKGAEAGDSILQNSLGYYYATGEYIKQDDDLAFKWFSLASEKGNPEAMCNIACIYAQKRDWESGVPWLKKAAMLNHAKSQFLLGELYTEGEHIRKDAIQGTYWLRKASENGLSDAMNTLAFCLLEGIGVDQNTEEAILWIKKSYELGNAIAMSNMGLLYERGIGVEKDISKAASFYQRAIESGNVEANFSLGRLYYNGAKGLRRDKKKGKELIRIAAEADVEEAKEFLKNMK